MTANPVRFSFATSREDWELLEDEIGTLNDLPGASSPVSVSSTHSGLSPFSPHTYHLSHQPSKSPSSPTPLSPHSLSHSPLSPHSAGQEYLSSNSFVASELFLNAKRTSYIANDGSLQPRKSVRSALSVIGKELKNNAVRITGEQLYKACYEHLSFFTDSQFKRFFNDALESSLNIYARKHEDSPEYEGNVIHLSRKHVENMLQLISSNICSMVTGNKTQSFSLDDIAESWNICNPIRLRLLRSCLNMFFEDKEYISRKELEVMLLHVVTGKLELPFLTRQVLKIMCK